MSGIQTSSRETCRAFARSSPLMTQEPPSAFWTPVELTFERLQQQPECGVPYQAVNAKLVERCRLSASRLSYLLPRGRCGGAHSVCSPWLARLAAAVSSRTTRVAYPFTSRCLVPNCSGSVAGSVCKELRLLDIAAVFQRVARFATSGRGCWSRCSCISSSTPSSRAEAGEAGQFSDLTN